MLFNEGLVCIGGDVDVKGKPQKSGRSEAHLSVHDHGLLSEAELSHRSPSAHSYVDVQRTASGDIGAAHVALRCLTYCAVLPFIG